MKKGLTQFFAKEGIMPFLSSNNWKFSGEVEGVLRLQQALTTLLQNEIKINGSYNPILKQRTRAHLVSSKIDLIEVQRWNKYNKPPQVSIAVSAMSNAGKNVGRGQF